MSVSVSFCSTAVLKRLLVLVPRTGGNSEVDAVDGEGAAGMVDGFECEIDGVDGSVDGVDSRIDGVNDKVDAGDSEVDAVATEVHGTEVWVDGVGVRSVGWVVCTGEGSAWRVVGGGLCGVVR